MRFVLVRHGQSGNNLLMERTGSDAGRDPDTLLTELGEEQAQALAAYASAPGLPWAPTHLYCSPMSRAVQTAAPLAAALDLPLVAHRELYEVGGPYDVVADGRVPHPGGGRDALAALSPRLVLGDWAGPDGWWAGQVERTEAELVARADRVIAGLRETHEPDDVVVLVSHGGFGNVLLRRLLGVDGFGGVFEIANTALALVEDAGPNVWWETTAVRINWLPHLQPEQLSDSAVPVP